MVDIKKSQGGIPPPILSPPAVPHIDNSRPDQRSLSRIDSRMSRSISPRTRFQIPSTRPCSTNCIPHRRAPLLTPSTSVRSIISLTSRVLHPSLFAMYQIHRHASSSPLDHSDFNKSATNDITCRSRYSHDHSSRVSAQDSSTIVPHVI